MASPKVSIIFTLMLLFVELVSLSMAQKTSPFEFIKELQGSRKGDKVDGLNKLKKYLHRFGYLSDSYKIQTDHGGNNEENNFDDVLESAIKTYQVNYNLNVTGTLNVETISKMMIPRCGVPDIVNGETWMPSGKGKTTTQDQHGYNKTNDMVSNYLLWPERYKWPGTRPRLTYGYSNNRERTQFVNAVNPAFRRWASSTGGRFTFTFTSTASTANIRVGIYRGAHGDVDPFDGPHGILAHAFAPTDGRMHFDGDEDFAFGSVPGVNQYHIESVALHEIGHLLGLRHSSDPTALMFPDLQTGQVKYITQDEINGINALYN